MYSREPVRPEMTRLSIAVLSDTEQFKAYAIEMLGAWPESACAHLCDPGRGRRAWVGQATCCFVHGATVAETCEAWVLMPRVAQIAANDAALQAILIWEASQRDQLTLGF